MLTNWTPWCDVWMRTAQLPWTLPLAWLPTANNHSTSPVAVEEPEPQDIAEPIADSAPSVSSPASQAQALHLAQCHATVAYAVWKSQGGVVALSPNWHEVTGLLPLVCEGEGFFTFLADNTAARLVMPLANALAGAAEGGDSSEGDIIGHDGSARWCRFTLSPLHEEGQETAVLILVENRQEWKALSDAASAAKVDCAAAKHGTVNFLSNMSHELRTPLNAILGFVQLMEGGVFGPIGNDKYIEYVTHIRDSGGTLLSKINDLLEIANIEARQNGAMHAEPVEFAELLESVVEMHRHAAFTAGVTIDVENSAPGLSLHGDRHKLMLAISHLLSNAIRHSAPNSSVQIAVKADVKRGISIGVRDFGAGIPMTQLAKIRESMAQGEAYLETGIDSIGLGLATVHAVADLHGGELTIDSVPTQGTIAGIYLPPSRIIHLAKPAASRRLSYKPKLVKV